MNVVIFEFRQNMSIECYRSLQEFHFQSQAWCTPHYICALHLAPCVGFVMVFKLFFFWSTFSPPNLLHIHPFAKTWLSLQREAGHHHSPGLGFLKLANHQENWRGLQSVQHLWFHPRSLKSVCGWGNPTPESGVSSPTVT